MWCVTLGLKFVHLWRLGSESNRCTRLCRPLGIYIIRYLRAFCHTLTPALLFVAKAKGRAGDRIFVERRSRAPERL